MSIYKEKLKVLSLELDLVDNLDIVDRLDFFKDVFSEVNLYDILSDFEKSVLVSEGISIEKKREEIVLVRDFVKKLGLELERCLSNIEFDVNIEDIFKDVYKSVCDLIRLFGSNLYLKESDIFEELDLLCFEIYSLLIIDKFIEYNLGKYLEDCDVVSKDEFVFLLRVLYGIDNEDIVKKYLKSFFIKLFKCVNESRDDFLLENGSELFSLYLALLLELKSYSDKLYSEFELLLSSELKKILDKADVIDFRVFKKLYFDIVDIFKESTVILGRILDDSDLEKLLNKIVDYIEEVDLLYLVKLFELVDISKLDDIVKRKYCAKFEKLFEDRMVISEESEFKELLKVYLKLDIGSVDNLLDDFFNKCRVFIESKKERIDVYKFLKSLFFKLDYILSEVKLDYKELIYNRIKEFFLDLRDKGMLEIRIDFDYLIKNSLNTDNIFEVRVYDRSVDIDSSKFGLDLNLILSEVSLDSSVSLSMENLDIVDLVERFKGKKNLSIYCLRRLYDKEIVDKVLDSDGSKVLKLHLAVESMFRFRDYERYLKYVEESVDYVLSDVNVLRNMNRDFDNLIIRKRDGSLYSAKELRPELRSFLFEFLVGLKDVDFDLKLKVLIVLSFILLYDNDSLNILESKNIDISELENIVVSDDLGYSELLNIFDIVYKLFRVYEYNGKIDLEYDRFIVYSKEEGRRLKEEEGKISVLERLFRVYLLNRLYVEGKKNSLDRIFNILEGMKNRRDFEFLKSFFKYSDMDFNSLEKLVRSDKDFLDYLKFEDKVLLSFKLFREKNLMKFDKVRLIDIKNLVDKMIDYILDYENFSFNSFSEVYKLIEFSYLRFGLECDRRMYLLKMQEELMKSVEFYLKEKKLIEFDMDFRDLLKSYFSDSLKNNEVKRVLNRSIDIVKACIILDSNYFVFDDFKDSLLLDIIKNKREIKNKLRKVV